MKAMNRRTFVTHTGSCAAWLGAAMLIAPPAVRRAFARQARGVVIAQDPWGRLEEVGEGLWALISTPLVDDPGARLTLANGGIVAGSGGVALIEGLASEDGARWMASQARELTGRPVDHVILTHYHGDHSSGLSAHAEAGVTLHVAPTTAETLRRRAADRGEDAESPVDGFGPERLQRVDESRPTRIDLGNRTLEIRPGDGHTDSDLWVAVEDPPVVWCGDLVWNGMVPNYMDATPSRLSATVRRIAAADTETWVPGHGDLAGGTEMERYVALIDDIEDAARRAHEEGVSAEAAADDYRPPAALGEWVLFGRNYYARAFQAWHDELGV